MADSRGFHTVVVEIKGGLVTNIVADAPVRVVVLDHDTEGADDDELVEIDGRKAYLSSFGMTEIDLPRVQEAWKVAIEYRNKGGK
jgi:hypothetical protein